jgi:hypothetical protein
MPVGRGPNFKQLPLNIVGSSKFGIYPKMSSEKTYNLTISDGFLVPYPGYKIGIHSPEFFGATRGRALYESVKIGRIIAVFNESVYLINLTYNHQQRDVINHEVVQIGTIQTDRGPVYISENNKPQILISDGQYLYIYDPSVKPVSDTFTFDNTPDTLNFLSSEALAIGEPVTLTASGGAVFPTIGGNPAFATNTTYYISSLTNTSTTSVVQLAASVNDVYNNNYIKFDTNGVGTFTLNAAGSFQTVSTQFTPGYISFHDTYFLCAASGDNFYAPPANNTWRLSMQNNGFIWPSVAQTVGLLETKPDNTQAVLRFPSRGNMIFVMGETVTEAWFDTGAQLFPYQRQDQFNIDYGCLNPATVAYMDEIVVWLAANEKSGPIIMYSTGGQPQKVTTDGIDFEFSQLETPKDAQGFLYRKNGHLFYHLNFYTDNISYVVDFTDNKIYNACDENRNYYQMGQVVWFNNQYFSVTRNNGNLFIFDTVFTTYKSVDSIGNATENEIPRVRLPSQDYFIVNDIGFTIQTGDTDYYPQVSVPEGGTPNYIIMQNGNYIQFQNGNRLTAQDVTPYAPVTSYISSLPRVDLSLSYDGGATFGQDFPYVLNPIGKRRNKLIWWQGGMSNDCVVQIKMYGIGSCVITDGVVNIRQ